ncbi:hypothetical protein CRES_1869 [Corynebacterium resistens DSM 45100]|uniref:Uncharacterized protein n=1 Tax=Corynebacterium resistens (strain DSM 45100 / JCM 12819 / GTC 2026 / SICGH 158) TaxID=662755 RepID=F8E2A4_CORRG|nr:hypothetical protein CRES_1869 [Corynebacterium resistens DSM 45100]
MGEDQPQPCALALTTRKLRDWPIRQIGATRPNKDSYVYIARNLTNWAEALELEDTFLANRDKIITSATNGQNIVFSPNSVRG